MADSQRRLNPAHLACVRSIAEQSPFLQMLGVRMADLSLGYCRSETHVTRDLLNVFGGVHGGAYAALLDNATYWSLYCGVDEGAGYTTIDLNVSDLRSAREGLLVIEGRAVKYGRTLCLSEGTIKDESGRLLAHATSKCLVADGIQPISEAVARTGADPLPPKYLD